MTERPILFSAPMVRALLAGTKTQTRRVVKPQPLPNARSAHFGNATPDGEHKASVLFSATAHCAPPWAAPAPVASPYGQPGDRLWVRENGWERPPRTPKMMREGADTWARYYYDADGLNWQEVEDFKTWRFKRRPSIHMPRWASRILLEVTGVRVERLQDISEADAIAEGLVEQRGGGWGLPDGSHYHGVDPRISYWSLWEAINGPGSVEADPWVWAVSFNKQEAR